jgi:hypothetical protein
MKLCDWCGKNPVKVRFCCDKCRDAYHNNIDSERRAAKKASNRRRRAEGYDPEKRRKINHGDKRAKTVHKVSAPQTPGSGMRFAGSKLDLRTEILVEAVVMLAQLRAQAGTEHEQARLIKFYGLKASEPRFEREYGKPCSAYA